MFALYSPNGTYDNIFLANYAYININDQMTRVKGIASVSVFGFGSLALRVVFMHGTTIDQGILKRDPIMHDG